MKNSNNIYNMEGLGKVYSFTLSQTFKSPTYRMGFIVFVLMFTLMGPITRLSSSAGLDAAKSGDGLFVENEAASIQLCNKTNLPIDADRISEYLKETAFESLPITESDDISGLKEDELALVFDRRTIEDTEYFVVNGVISDDSLIESSQLDALCSELTGMLAEARREAAELTEDQITVLSSGIQQGDCMSYSDYINQDKGSYTASQVFQLNMVYCIVIMILIALTSSYVVSSVMEEKSSKLVENLLVSVRPLALVMGKILAMMTYVFLMIGLGLLGSVISGSIMKNMEGEEIVQQTSQFMDFSRLFSQGAAKGALIVVCMLLTYLIFAILAGLLGSGCVKPEDAQSAIGTVTMLNMAGYLLGCFIPMLENRTLDIVLSIVPFTSGYLAPVFLITGRIPLWAFLCGMAMELVTIALLFMLCAKTYRKLIVNDSKRLGILQILKLSVKGV
ncbi:MAG: ABC transporter permease [Lachnospiraceae bacterium]|nr:ABC transporter permease [Lachnospiraceae bacterium]